MANLTLEKHGDPINSLLAFYKQKAKELEDSGQFFMAAVALAFGLETMLLPYLLVELEPADNAQNGIPDSVSMSDLTFAANYIDALNAPIDVASHVRDDGSRPKYIAKDAVNQINKFRRLIHPSRALKEGFDPTTFTRQQLQQYWEMMESVAHSLLYYI